MDKNNEYLGVTEASQLLGVNPRTILRYIANGRLNAQKMGVSSAAFILKREDVLAVAKA